MSCATHRIHACQRSLVDLGLAGRLQPDALGIAAALDVEHTCARCGARMCVRVCVCGGGSQVCVQHRGTWCVEPRSAFEDVLRPTALARAPAPAHRRAPSSARRRR
jgi:hypothetical protein